MASFAGTSQGGNHSPWIGMLSVTKDTPARHSGTCELCGCHTDQITIHHLYPRAAARRAATSSFPFTLEQKESVAAICWPCHCIIHRLLPPNILASSFHSIDLLKTHDGGKKIAALSQAGIDQNTTKSGPGFSGRSRRRCSTCTR
jgi:hypothetical protein